MKRPNLKRPHSPSRRPTPSPPKRGAMMKGIKGYQRQLRKQYERGM